MREGEELEGREEGGWITMYNTQAAIRLSVLTFK